MSQGSAIFESHKNVPPPGATTRNCGGGAALEPELDSIIAGARLSGRSLVQAEVQVLGASLMPCLS
jgi:hypothetical protein